MVKGEKHRTNSYELSNKDILRRCNTENVHKFIAQEQCNFIAYVIRGENHRMAKRLLFNDDDRKKSDAL